ncbi:mercury resistance system transport protein MerF [Roseovarius nitratireducens]|uniref:mercury resistance system transport protein MerF n=1 Tax=Roseovarius nitratireducens TaxID=2044597 RepID=UPI001F0B99C4|nr:mercury resistance system transport protein MerF [Roseovarius nitratireducens]
MSSHESKHKRLLKRGLIGSCIAAICCFTPFLVVIVAGVGLSAFVGWLDYALFPMLFASLSVIAYALWLEAGKPGRSPKSLLIVLAVTLSALLLWLEFRFALRISVAAALAVAGYALWLRKSGRVAAELTDSEPR